MAVKKVIQYPDKCLTTPTCVVENFDQDLCDFISDMYDTMHQQEGVGLAANQVGDSRRVFVFINQETNKEECLVNPQIVSSSGKKVHEEGCLSFPGLFIEVERFDKVTLKLQRLDGRSFYKDYSDFNSVIVQHELDHLDGIVFIDRYLRQTKKKKNLNVESWVNKKNKKRS